MLSSSSPISLIGSSNNNIFSNSNNKGAAVMQQSSTTAYGERPQMGLDVEYGVDPASGAFFQTDGRKHEDLKQMLDSNKDGLKLEAMKRIIGMIARGRDASELFPAVVKNVVSKNIEVKKLVYVYLVRYAEEQQDLALLSISTFQRALKDPNQLIRASALRVLSSIRVNMIVPIVMLAIRDSASDMSPYVRKTAAHAIPKLYSLDPEQKDELVTVIEKLLSDRTTLVVGSAVMAFDEVCPERVDLIHKNYRKLCNLLVDVDEWGQVIIINMLTRYARTQFVDPNIDEILDDKLNNSKRYNNINDDDNDDDDDNNDDEDNDDNDDDDSNDSATSSSSSSDTTSSSSTTSSDDSSSDDNNKKKINNNNNNKSQKKSKSKVKTKTKTTTKLQIKKKQDDDPYSLGTTTYHVDLDHRLLLRQTKPLLQSRNASVVMAVSQLYHHIAPRTEVQLIAKALIRLLRSHKEVQSVVLTCIASMSTKRKSIFEPHIKSFFVRTSDPTHIKLLKLDILTNLASASTISLILREFQTYISSNDRSFVAATIQAIGRCAGCIKEVTETCLNGLVHLLSNRDEHVVAESVVVIKKLLQTKSAEHYEIISQMAKILDFITVPAARASIIWLIGEYNEKVPLIAPDILRKMAKTFVDEEDAVKLQILNLGVKLYLINPLQTSLLCQYVFTLARYDTNYDVRDRARFLHQFIFPEKGNASILSQNAHKIFLSPKPAPALESKYMSRDRFQLGSLSHYLNMRTTGYTDLPTFPTIAPDSSVRFIETNIPDSNATAIQSTAIGKTLNVGKGAISKGSIIVANTTTTLTSGSVSGSGGGGSGSSLAAAAAVAKVGKLEKGFFTESDKSDDDSSNTESSNESENEIIKSKTTTTTTAAAAIATTTTPTATINLTKEKLNQVITTDLIDTTDNKNMNDDKNSDTADSESSSSYESSNSDTDDSNESTNNDKSDTESENNAIEKRNFEKAKEKTQKKETVIGAGAGAGAITKTSNNKGQKNKTPITTAVAATTATTTSANNDIKTKTKTDLELLLDLDDIPPIGPVMTPSFGGFLTPGTQVFSTMSGLLLQNDVNRIDLVGPSFIEFKHKEIINKLSGHGLQVSYRFTRSPHLYSSAMVSIELLFINQSNNEINDIILGQRTQLPNGINLKEFAPIQCLLPQQRITSIMGIDFNDSTQSIEFEIISNVGKSIVNLKPPIGELIRSVQITDEHFKEERTQLRGLNEHQTHLDLKRNNIDLTILKQRIYESLNVAIVKNTIITNDGGNGGGVGGDNNILQFVGQTMNSKSLVLITLEWSTMNRGEKLTLLVNCEKMVIGSMVLNELRTAICAGFKC